MFLDNLFNAASDWTSGLGFDLSSVLGDSGSGSNVAGSVLPFGSSSGGGFGDFIGFSDSGGNAAPAATSAATPSDVSGSITQAPALPQDPFGVQSPALDYSSLVGTQAANPGISTDFPTSGAPNAPTGLKGLLKDNPWILPSLGVLGTVTQSKTAQVPQQRQLQNSTNTLLAQGTQLMAPLTTGAALPGGLQQQIQQSADAQKAAVRSRFAQMGMSGSSAELSALNAVDQGVQAQVLADATALSSQGLSMINSADANTKALMDVQLSKDNALTAALGKVAAAFANTSLT